VFSELKYGLYLIILMVSLKGVEILLIKRYTLKTLTKNLYDVCLMVFNATFNNISVISWWSVLLVGETEGPGENHRLVASH